jgi:hypothetical protein
MLLPHLLTFCQKYDIVNTVYIYKLQEVSLMDTNKELNYRLFIQLEEDFKRTAISSEFSRYDDIKNGDVEKVKANFVEIRRHYY